MLNKNIEEKGVKMKNLYSIAEEDPELTKKTRDEKGRKVYESSK